MEVSVGGGTHIAKALHYTRSLITQPSRAIVTLITDFEEGASTQDLIQQVRALHQSGAKLLGLAALDDHGKPRYHKPIASQVAAAGMPVAALSPQELTRWIAQQLRA
jgi:uncharacterized protein with von Willebrand factor type A (vWA) domain